MLANSRGALVTIQARDFERAVTFYTKVLGLGLSFRRESYWAEVQAPGLTLGIEAAGDGTVVGGGTTTVVFEVRDIEGVAKALRARGVALVGPVQDSSQGRTASFLDSEGNPLLLHEPPASAEEPSRASKSRAAKRPAGAVSKPKRKAKSSGTKTRKKGAAPRAKAGVGRARSKPRGKR
jgi:predicted enzyme related to lactoylglutathione lyase